MDTFLSQWPIRRWDPWNPVLQMERSKLNKSAKELLPSLDYLLIMDIVMDMDTDVDMDMLRLLIIGQDIKAAVSK